MQHLPASEVACAEPPNPYLHSLAWFVLGYGEVSTVRELQFRSRSYVAQSGRDLPDSTWPPQITQDEVGVPYHGSDHKHPITPDLVFPGRKT